LLGDNPSPEMVARYSNELQVTPQTPQAFIVLSSDDRGVLPANSLRYYEALLANRVPVAMFMYPTGGHGWGFKSGFKYHEQVLMELAKWLE
jgi:dipeptidyl aminopeptidase/acylaminoacyl peptidase